MENHFKKLIANNELRHSYYFEGGKGLEFTLWLASHVLCCGDNCVNCDSIRSLQHPDLILISPETSMIKVDQIREIHERAAFKSFAGNGQVFIIDKADTLNLQAANALLKFLEDPKDNTYIFLIGNDEHKLITTIRSRVQVIKMPLNKNFMEEAIERGLDYKTLPLLEQLNYSVDDAILLAEHADKWFDAIKGTLSSTNPLIALQKVQEWPDLFTDKKAKTFCIQVIQNYARALVAEKRGQFHCWGTLPVYDYAKLLTISDAADELTRAFHSNGQFLLHVEAFIKKSL